MSGVDVNSSSEDGNGGNRGPYSNISSHQKESFIKQYEEGKIIKKAAGIADLNINTAKTILYKFKRDGEEKVFSFLFSSQYANNLSYLHQRGSAPFIYRTLGEQLTETALKYGDNEGLITMNDNVNTRNRMTFKEVLEKADRLAASLIELGLEPGDRIGIWGPNYSHWYLSMFAAARAGLISVALNPAYQAPEIEFCLKKVQIKAIITSENFKSQNYYEILKTILPEIEYSKPGHLNSQNLPSLKTVITDSQTKLPGTFTFNELLQQPSDSAIKQVEINQHLISPDSICNIQFTSGTTGTPKAACLSHFNIVNNSFFISKRFEFQLTNHKCLCQMPFFHVYGVVIVISSTLHNGTTTVTPGPYFNPKQSIEAITKEKCTLIHGTSTMYVDVLRELKKMQNTKLDSLEVAACGGASLPPKLYMEMKSTLGVQEVKTIYGLTETTSVCFQSLTEDKHKNHHDAVGKLHDHIEAKVVDDKGNVVPLGSTGELCIRGYCNMVGYWQDESKTKEIYDETKWLKTGDKFILTNDGYGQIVGRIKEMIIRGGENIYPKEIEDFLLTHPDIIECHVIGIPDERMGEEVCVFIRLVDSKMLSLEEIKLFCKGKIAHFKIPKYLRIVDSFPKTTSGKVQKFKLKEQF